MPGNRGDGNPKAQEKIGGVFPGGGLEIRVSPQGGQPARFEWKNIRING